jgi:hypothetical protein
MPWSPSALHVDSLLTVLETLDVFTTASGVSMLDDLQESIETWLEQSVMKSFPIPEEVVDAENKPGMIGT